MEPPSEGAHGIRETEDILSAAEEVLVSLIRVVRDGKVNISDAMELVSNTELSAALKRAAENINAVDEELGDLQPQEMFHLTRRGIDLTERVFIELKGQG